MIHFYLSLQRAKIKYSRRILAVFSLGILSFLTVSVLHAGAAEIKLFSTKSWVRDTASGGTSTLSVSADFVRGSGFGDEPIRHLKLTLPDGFIINQKATPQKCPTATFLDNVLAVDENRCASERPRSVVGEVYGNVGIHGRTSDIDMDEGRIFMLEPEKGEWARLGIHIYLWIGGPEITLVSSVYPDPDQENRFVMEIKDFPRSLWGSGVSLQQLRLVLGETTDSITGVPTKYPLVRIPTFCSVGSGELQAADYEDPARTSSEFISVPSSTDCSRVDFDPRAEMTRETNITELPTKADISAVVPSPASVDGRAQSSVSGLKVTTPEGLHFSPAFWEGLTTCSLSDFNWWADSQAAQCPDTSRIGTVKMRIDEHDQEFTGNLYLGRVKKPYRVNPQDPVGVDTEVFLEVADQDGKDIPWGGTGPFAAGEGWVKPFRFKTIGQLAIQKNGKTVLNFGYDSILLSPHLPFMRITKSTLSFYNPTTKRAAFANPSQCTQSLGSMSFTPWNGSPSVDRSYVIATQSRDGSVAGCKTPRVFEPRFQAAVNGDNQASSSPDGVTLSVSRDTDDDWMSGTKFLLPTGMSLDTTRLVECSWLNLDYKRCPPPSRIGSVNGKVGFDSETLTLASGDIRYMADDGAGHNVALVIDPKEFGVLDLDKLVIRGKLSTVAGSRVQLDISDIPPRFQGLAIPIQEMVLNIEPPLGALKNPSDCTVDRSFELQAVSLYDKTTTPAIKSSWKPTGGVGC